MKKIIMIIFMGLLTTGLFAHGNENNNTNFQERNEQNSFYSCVATYNFLTNTLHIPCVQVGEQIYWIDLELNSNSGDDNVTLRLKKADINNNYRNYMNERNEMGQNMDNRDMEDYRDSNMRMEDTRDNMNNNNYQNNNRMRNYRR